MTSSWFFLSTLKGTAVAVPAMKAYTESGGTTPLIFNLTTRRKRDQIHSPATLPSVIPTYAFNRRLGGSYSRYGRCAVDMNLLLFPGIVPQIILWCVIPVVLVQ